MTRFLMMFLLSLVVVGCGDSDDNAQTDPVDSALSTSASDEDDYDDYVDEGFEDDSMASDPELGSLSATIGEVASESRAYCSVLLLSDDAIENSTNIIIDLNVHTPNGKDESEWLSGEVSIRGAFDADSDDWRTSANYSVPAPEGTAADDTYFWMHDFVNPDSVSFSMQVSGAAFDYRTDALPESTSDYDDRHFETQLEWRGDMLGTLADGSQSRGMVQMRYSGICQITKP
ncbi:MAG: hypothetical protein AAF004_14875 [Pseudomonadota bacterium]